MIECRNGRRLYRSCSFAALVACTISHVWGHPGGIKEGRASCGKEFDSSASSFVIADIKEAWYLRRIATCEAPFFWTTFDVKDKNQPVYIAAISPQIPRFEDKLDFHAVLFGPGLPNISADALPKGVVSPSASLGGLVLNPPSDLGKCDFVDTNPVMKSFSDVIGGRCMEKLSLRSDYKDKLVAGAYYYSWWLYSKEFTMVEPGKYFLVSWLTDRGTSSLTTGKYEMTLGPWTWYGYADDATTKKMQSQITTCTCSVNRVEYVEQELPRIGFNSDDADVFAAAMPREKCGAGSIFAQTSKQQSVCRSAVRSASLSTGSSVEFAGRWKLKANALYLWTFRSFYPEWSYPDPGMDIYAKPCASVCAVAAEGDTKLSGAASSTVQHDGELSLSLSTKQTLKFRGEKNTTFRIQAAQDMDVCFFTQHRPEEFMAMSFKCSTCDKASKYNFPVESVLYGIGDTINPKACENSKIAESTSKASISAARFPVLMNLHSIVCTLMFVFLHD